MTTYEECLLSLKCADAQIDTSQTSMADSSWDLLPIPEREILSRSVTGKNANSMRNITHCRAELLSVEGDRVSVPAQVQDGVFSLTIPAGFALSSVSVFWGVDTPKEV